MECLIGFWIAGKITDTYFMGDNLARFGNYVDVSSYICVGVFCLFVSNFLKNETNRYKRINKQNGQKK